MTAKYGKDALQQRFYIAESLLNDTVPENGEQFCKWGIFCYIINSRTCACFSDTTANLCNVWASYLPIIQHIEILSALLNEEGLLYIGTEHLNVRLFLRAASARGRRIFLLKALWRIYIQVFSDSENIFEFIVYGGTQELNDFRNWNFEFIPNSNKHHIWGIPVP